MHNLFIIGNGFDLAHGLKTSYQQFMNGMKKKIYNEPGFFQDICNQEIEEAIISDTLGIKDTTSSIFKQKFFAILDKNRNNQNWSDIEYLYFMVLSNYKNSRYLMKTLNWDKGVFASAKEINEEFEIVKGYLVEHLIHEQNRFKPIDAYNDLFNLYNNTDTTVLNFNYTDTVQRYLKSSDKIKLINIHGELKSADNPIIFGFAADNEESKKLQLQNDNELLRNIKKTKYNLTDNEFSLKEALKQGDQVIVHVLGHSCGVSDNLILNQIFNDSSIHSICIYHYNEQEGYLQTAINIDRIIDDYSKSKDDEKNFAKLITYPQSIAMVQHDSSAFEYGPFLKKAEENQQNQPERDLLALSIANDKTSPYK